MLSPLRLACSNNCRRTSKSLDTITLHCRRIRKPTIELSLGPEEYHDLLSPKCPSGASKKPLIFVLLLILSAHLIQEGLNRRKTQENVATSTMVFSRIRTETVDGVLNEFEENPIPLPPHAITVGNCINVV